ncbi:hypothetical protein SAY86_024861 [Trapa natans]|uniref:Uncharacterized protein n=1 Tax=Trapa natans TaxID=22666 RepID=A0AAN7M6K8_TRANT|nr:hypothetical protein SAY86_024861 [Trapa natans]
MALGFSSVSTNIRMTVIKLKSGISRTEECIKKLIVSPIVKTLVLDKVLEKRIIPAHFAAPVTAGRSDLLATFAFLDDLLGKRYGTHPYLSLSLLFTSLLGKAASVMAGPVFGVCRSSQEDCLGEEKVMKQHPLQKWYDKAYEMQ